MRGDVFNPGDVVDVDAANVGGGRWVHRCTVLGSAKDGPENVYVVPGAFSGVPDRANFDSVVHVQTCTLVRRGAPELSFLAYLLPWVQRCAQPRPERGTMRGNWKDVRIAKAAAEAFAKVRR